MMRLCVLETVQSARNIREVIFLSCHGADGKHYKSVKTESSGKTHKDASSFNIQVYIHNGSRRPLERLFPGCKRAGECVVLHCVHLKKTVIVFPYLTGWKLNSAAFAMKVVCVFLLASSPGCWFLTWELLLSAESHLGCHGNGFGSGWICSMCEVHYERKGRYGLHLNAWLNLYNSSRASLLSAAGLKPSTWHSSDTVCECALTLFILFLFHFE